MESQGKGTLTETTQSFSLGKREADYLHSQSKLCSLKALGSNASLRIPLRIANSCGLL